MSTASGRRDPLRGILYIVAAMAVLSAADAAAKWLAPSYSAAQIMFVRSLLALGPALAILLLTQGRAGLRTQRLGAHTVRTVLMLLAWGTFIYALRELPLADAFTIAFVSPLFMTILGFLFLREAVRGARWGAVAFGFVGVLVVLQPSGTGFGLPALATLFAALAWAVSTLFSRRLTESESSETILFYYVVLSSGILALGLPTYDFAIAARDWPAFGVSTVAGLLGHWLIAQAFRYGEVSLLAPFEYLALVWALLLGYWIWGDQPNGTVLLGAAIIIASGIAVARMETRRRAEPEVAPEAI